MNAETKLKIVEKLKEARANFTGTDIEFSIKYFGAKTGAVWSQLKNGKIDGLLSESTWINLAQTFGLIDNKPHQIKIAETDVFKSINERAEFCQKHSKAMIIIDDPGTGKSMAAKYLSRTNTNTFLIDASQAKTKSAFVRLIAKSIGADFYGKLIDVKENIKFTLKRLPKPLMIIDDAGDLELNAFLEIKEFWNATEGLCGWLMIGDDSLKNLIERCIRSKKPGFKALLSRFSGTYYTITPNGREDKQMFYINLIRQVLEVNLTDKTNIDALIKKCLVTGADGEIGGLRRVESILILNNTNY